MEFRILGPLEVISDGRSLSLTRSKQRALLSALLLRPNEAVSIDHLIEALWGERAPPTATTALHGHVSRLRKLLPLDRLHTRPPGYLLQVEPGELDLERFEELRREGRDAIVAERPQEAATVLRQALALWRGQPLSDLADEPWARTEIARLTEQHHAALEERIEAELALGMHAELVAELELLVGASPFRERLRAQLMLALYRAGRQTEALHVYQEGRRVLVDELGIEPSPVLQRLQQQILAHDLVLQAPEPQVIRVPSRAARKTVTVLAWELELDAGDPEALRSQTDRTLKAVQATIERHGGAVEGVLGDLALAVFGAEEVQEDNPLRAVRAAAELRDESPIRIGIATGEVIVDDAGVTGGAVARARQLQQLARPGEIVLAEATRRLVRDATAVEPLDGSESAFRLLSLDPQAAGLARRLDSPLVGRLRELQLLESSCEHALAGCRPSLVTLLGPAGVGKSRLIAELVTRSAPRAAVLRGRCLSYGEGITFWPVLELIRDATGVAGNDPPERVIAGLGTLLGGGAEATRACERLAGLFGVGDAEATAEELFSAVQLLLETLARERPLIVVLDDMENAEPTLLDLIEHIVDSSRDVPLLLVCLARPELLDQRPMWGGGRSNAMSLSLEPLNADDSGSLIENLLGGGALAAAAAGRLAETAEGNPLFLEQLVAMLIDDGLLRRDDGRWVAVADLTDVPVPASIQLLLAARLDRLGPDELEVLGCAAVQGMEFHREALPEGDDVDAALATLVRKDLVRPSADGDRRFRFRHLLIRDAAYRGLPKARRAELHAHVAGWVEHRAGGRLAEFDEIVAYHLEQAHGFQNELGRDDEARELGLRAGRLLASAGRRAIGRADVGAAAQLLTRMAALLPSDDPERLERLVDLGAACTRIGDFGGADAAFAEAENAARAQSKTTLVAQIVLERAELQMHTQPTLSTRNLVAAAEAALPAFERDRSNLGAARCLKILAVDAWNRGAAAAVERQVQDALVWLDADGPSWAVADLRAHLATLAVDGPGPVDEELQRCHELEAAVSGEPRAEAWIRGCRGLLDGMGARFEVGRALVTASIEALGEIGDALAVVHWQWRSAQLELLAREPLAAEQLARSALTSADELGAQGYVSTASTVLARALLGQGRDDDAERYAALAEEAAWPESILDQVPWRVTRAMLLVGRGAPDAAEPVAREAVALAAACDNLNLRGDAHAALADVLAALGQKAAAAGESEQARLVYERKGNVAAAGTPSAVS